MRGAFVPHQKVYYSSACFKYFVAYGTCLNGLGVFGSIFILFGASMHLYIIPQKSILC